MKERQENGQARYGHGYRLGGLRTDRTSPRQSIGSVRRARNAYHADPIVNSYDLGDSIDEIHEGFPTLSVAQIKRLIEFAHAQRRQHNP